MAQPGFGPPSLPVGTEVSAKYRGAFCEAKVKTVVRLVKCKLVMKDGQSNIFVTDEEVKGAVKVGAVVEIKHPTTSLPVEATISKLIDSSTYTVVFDDGDERTLRRTQLCLKGDKHFIESETLDNLPLSHPEHFGTPVLHYKKARRKNEGDESDDGEDKSDEETPRRAMYRGRHQELVGKIMLVDLPNRKGSVIPALVVLPDASSSAEVKNRDQILVRSFKDSKFITALRKNLKDFSRAVAVKNDDKTMRAAFEKSLLYHDTKELPVGWDKNEMLGSDFDSGDVDDEYASEDEPFEEKDRFVAQLYKFMDERGTPINKGPCIGNKDLNLYRLYKIVKNLGGYNKVTKEMKWPIVYSKMGLTSVHLSPAHQIKTAYKKYLDAFETFYRKLGSTMGTMSRPGRSRQSGGRSILSFRAREKTPKSPKLPEKATPNKDSSESTKPKPQTPADKPEDTQVAASLPSSTEGDVVIRRTPRRDAGAQILKEESKDKKEEIEKVKKEESPKSKKEEKKEESSLPKAKKEDTPVAKLKKEEAGSGTKTKKDEPIKGKKEDESLIKDERKSARKIKVEDEKSNKVPQKEKEDDSKEESNQEIAVPVKDSPKKRVTRRKLLPAVLKTDPEVKEEIEEKKETIKKQAIKEPKTVEKKEEIPCALEKREVQVPEKKEPLVKITEKKEKPVEKNMKPTEEKKPKREKKGKEDGGEEEVSDDGKTSSISVQSEEGEDLDQEDVEYPIGSRLRVKYGRGKNQKIYIAKVIELGKDGMHRTYLVHYAGWNTRYDEWIRPDRVVSVLDKPEGENSRTPPSRSPSIPGCSKDSLSPSSTDTTKIPMGGSKPRQIFRRPNLIGARMRATRSSSSDMMVARKRMTRRRSVLTDSAGSRSPESHMSSGADDASDSEQAGDDDDIGDEDDDDDYESTKEGSPKDDSLDIDDYEKAEESLKEKSVDGDTYMREEAYLKEEAECEIGSPDRLTEEDGKVESEKRTKKLGGKDSHSISHPVERPHAEAAGENTQASAESEEKKDLKDLLRKDNFKEKFTSDEVKTFHSSGVKRERLSVFVAEVNEAVYEIKSSVYYAEDVVKLEEDDNEARKARVMSEIDAGFEEVEPATPEVQESTKSVEKDGTEEKFDQTSKVAEEAGPCVVADLSSPQLKKIETEQEKKDSQPEKAKGVRGKKAGAKDGKKFSRISDVASTSAAPDIAAVEPVAAPPVPSSSKLEPSPYDFDAEVDTPWHPEITKKWEPSQKASLVKEQKEPVTISEEGDERDKKVKKKVKKKSMTPEAVEEKVNVSGGEAVPADCSDKAVALTGVDTPVEGKTSAKKKGRKKKELSSEAKKEVIELYESTVNSVVEAVKHSLQETESDHEHKPAVKKRRLKRLSESDKKDNTVRVTRVGRKVANRDSIEVLDSSSYVEEHKTIREQTSTSSDSAQNEPPVLEQNAPINELLSASAFSVETEDNVDSKDVKEPSFCESQGFEPQLHSLDASAHFDNTPPTTPEHDEEENRNATIQLAENLCHLSDVASKSDPHKEGVKALCSLSATASSSLPASSCNFTPLKSANELPSDNDVISTGSNENLDTPLNAQQSEGSGTDQDVPFGKKKNACEEISVSVTDVKKRRVHGTRSRTAKKSPKYTGHSDSQGSASNTPNHCPESPPVKFADLSKSPRPSKYTFNADLGEYLEGEARCNFLINKMREIKSIYMTLKSEVASIDRRRKRAKRKERESSQISGNEREVPT